MDVTTPEQAKIAENAGACAVMALERIPATFIRAPYITSAENDVDVLAKVDEEIVAVQYKKQLVISFHPELDHDLSMYRYFLQEIVHKKSSSEIYP